MKNQSYSMKFKQQAVAKFINRGSKSVEQVASELNTSSKNLYRWTQTINENIMKNKKEKSTEEKFKILMETAGLNEHDLGEYLRKHGLHSSHLQEWKENFIHSEKSIGRPKKDPEVLILKKEKINLQKDLRRKEKALAEMSARVILLKKSQEIFGDNEEDE